MSEKKLKTFDRRVEKWLDDDLSKGFFRKICFYWYSMRVPKVGLLWLLEWVLKLSIPASAPLIWHYLFQTIDLSQATAAAAVIVTLQVLVGLVAYLRARASFMDTLPGEEIWVRMGDLLDTVDSGSTVQGRHDDAVNAALGIIEVYARHVTGSEAGDTSVSLVLYTDETKEKMLIKHRNPGNTRPKKTFANLRMVLGHRACQRGPEPRIINNILRFGRKTVTSPTQLDVPYRAIIIVPIQKVAGGDEAVVGFLSVDCSTPYAFFGKRGDNILVTSTPLMDHIVEQL